MKTILFVINEAGEFVELSKVALALKSRGYNSSFLFTSSHYVNLYKDTTICESHGFNYYHPSKSHLPPAPVILEEKATDIEEKLGNGYIPYSFLLNPEKNYRIKSIFIVLLIMPLIFPQLIYKTILRLSKRPFMLLMKPFYKLHFIHNFYYAYKVINKNNFDLLVFGQDYPGSINSSLIKSCRKSNIPTLIIPFALGTTKEIVESLYDKKQFRVLNSPINRLASILFPKWVNYYKGEKMLRLTGNQILILEFLGLSPKHPWLPNSSYATHIAVESPKMHSYYKSMQFPSEQLCLTGSLSDDILAEGEHQKEKIKAALCKELGLDYNKPILLCAWPTNQYGSRFTPLEFKSFEPLCNAWAKSLRKILQENTYSIIIRPHPVTNSAILKSILVKYGLSKYISYKDTIKLMIVSDLFVACVSSTLRWAISKGIPAINYDCYKYGYTDFDAKGVFNVDNYKDFNKVLHDLTYDSEQYNTAKKAQEQSAPDWGVLDGNSKHRIIDLVNKLLHQHNSELA